jgi:pyroglutamyl-peptidase
VVAVLATGFEPFGRWSVNSSERALAALPCGVDEVATRILPVDHEAAEDALAAALAETGARLLLMTGLADGAAPRLELRARRPAHRAEGPAMRAGLWPWAAARDAMRAAGASSAFSTDAGRYVCETTYYAGLDRLGRGVARAAFLHLPPVSADWPAERLAAAVGACLTAGRRAA